MLYFIYIFTMPTFRPQQRIERVVPVKKNHSPKKKPLQSHWTDHAAPIEINRVLKNTRQYNNKCVKGVVCLVEKLQYQ